MLPFVPDALPLSSLDWGALIDLMGTANREIARYDGLLQSIPNPRVLLAPLRTQEAVLSSKIEGTQATLEEVLEFDASPQKNFERRDDIAEVINYRKALAYANEEMETRPISLNMIRRVHSLLLEGVRGENKDKGNFRKIQNWIGSHGSDQSQARYVPPTVPVMMDALDKWEKYIHEDEKDFLVQLAIIHAQFEIIHPFLDGNGRIGRILIPLFLYHKEVIHQPVFYLSHYLETNRQQYYDALKSISDTGQWTQWIRFFLQGLIEQSKRNSEKTKNILALYDEMKLRVVNSTHSQFAIQTIDCLFKQPVFNTAQFIESTGMPRASASRILNTLTEEGIILQFEKGAGRKPSIFAFRDILTIVNK
ncbi:Fic family protein [Rufibacter immobilis]|uniref:Fic family protein n=1 Tax=Rufibacter immobilis TaxID=1348778 RepID=UPI0035E7AF19